jgi:hypothetical protein
MSFALINVPPYAWREEPREGWIIMMEPTWRKSSQCDSNACVEVGQLGDDVLIRQSAEPDGETLRVSRDGWATFLRELGKPDPVV